MIVQNCAFQLDYVRSSFIMVFVLLHFECPIDVEDGFVQMGKQTMGFPAQALQHRADNKMYRIQVLEMC